jgi:IclR family acetate operon transcriptional repressor
MQKEPHGVREKTSPAYPIASVDNALRLLLMFKDRQQVRLSDAGEYLGVAHSTAHRLLAMLAYHDFVRQERGQRTYVAGPALVEIGLAVVRNMDVRTRARPILEELAAQFGETVHLSRLEDGSVLYLDAVESQRALRVAARTGNMLPAHCTASGKALLAHLPDDQLRELYPPRRALPTLTSRSIQKRSDLERELLQVRELGYATNDEESEDGVTSVAAAVLDARGSTFASLSVSVPVSRMTDQRRDQVIAAVRDAARRLSEAFRGGMRKP